jgi:hypothetical protein
MLQVFCLYVTKLDLDVAYTCMLQAYVLSVLRCFICMFASVLSGCCISLQWFSNIFSGVFASVSESHLFQVFHIFFYVTIVVSGYFKSRSGVAYRMRVGRSRRHWWRLGRRWRRPGQRAGPLLVHFLASLTRYARVRSLCRQRPNASARIRRPATSKSNKRSLGWTGAAVPAGPIQVDSSWYSRKVVRKSSTMISFKHFMDSSYSIFKSVFQLAL